LNINLSSVEYGKTPSATYDSKSHKLASLTTLLYPTGGSGVVFIFSLNTPHDTLCKP
jgi:hypothetical protein